jgi:hypothetical protein
MRASLSAIQWESELLARSLNCKQVGLHALPPFISQGFHLASASRPLFRSSRQRIKMNPPPPRHQCKQPGSNMDTVGRQQEQSCRHSSDTWIFADPSFQRKQQRRQTESPVQWLWHFLTVVIWSDEKAAACRPCRHSSDTWSLQIQAFKKRNNEDRQTARCKDSNTSWTSSSPEVRKQQQQALAVTLQIYRSLQIQADLMQLKELKDQAKHA